MATLQCYMSVELVDNLCNYHDKEEVNWLFDSILTDLILHSNEIGDTISKSVKLQDVSINTGEKNDT